MVHEGSVQRLQVSSRCSQSKEGSPAGMHRAGNPGDLRLQIADAARAGLCPQTICRFDLHKIRAEARGMTSIDTLPASLHNLTAGQLLHRLEYAQEHPDRYSFAYIERIKHLWRESPRTPANVCELLVWLRANGITPLPCITRTKGPIEQISTRSVYGECPGDSFHIPTPERLDVINNWWGQEEYHKATGPSDQAVSIDCDPGYNSGRRVIGIDVDTDALFTAAIDCPQFLTAPAVRGKKGVKIFFFTVSQNLPAQIQYYGDDKDHPALEVFTAGKHLLVYGEHPDSSPDKRILYQFLRGFGLPIPSFSWNWITDGVEYLVHAGKLTISEGTDKTHQTPNHSVKKTGDKTTSKRVTLASRLGLRIEDVCRPENPVIMGTTIMGAHPIHGSTSGRNLHVHVTDQVWYCHRCRVGGGVAEWLLVEWGLKHGYSDCSTVLKAYRETAKTFHKIRKKEVRA